MTWHQIKNGHWCIGECIEVMSGCPDNYFDMILCDLPYGTTQNKWDSVIPFDKLWEQYWRIAKPNTPIVLTATQPFSSGLVMSCPHNFAYEWIWQKSRVTGVLNAKRQPLRQHESVLIFYRKPPTYNAQGTVAVERQTSTGVSRGKSSNNYGTISATPCGTYTQTTTGWPRSILPIASVGKTLHPTQKPVELFEYLIKTYTNEGDTVLDNCAGSGTTAIACENTNRKWVCIEQDPDYSAKAIERITNHVL